MDTSSVKIFGALLGGVIPSILWLWFWLREDKLEPEPRTKLMAVFLAGMVGVLIVLPVEKIIFGLLNNTTSVFTLISWAAAEEIVKYGVAYVTALRSREADEPIDLLMYMITAALGFSALENSLFLLDLVGGQTTTQSIISGNMRFLGATLLHTLSSGVLGVMLAFSMFKQAEVKKMAVLTGLCFAIGLHAIFNFFIMNSGQQIFFVFGGVWLAIIVLLLIFEKIKTIRTNKI